MTRSEKHENIDSVRSQNKVRVANGACQKYKTYKKIGKVRELERVPRNYGS